MASKVRFNLKNVHYALLTVGTNTVTYGTPVAVPGAVSLNLAAQGDLYKFYADGIVYYQAGTNAGYEGELEMAKFPPQMLKDIWKETETTTSKVLIENAEVDPAPFALLFQIDGDAEDELYVMYNCAATRPGVAAQTNTETKEAQTQSCTITAAPLADGKVQAHTQETTTTSARSAWFTSVFMGD